MDDRCRKGHELTPKKLRRILRWARNKGFSLEITDEYYGSRGNFVDRWEGKITFFSVDRDGDDFKATIFLDSGQTAERWFDRSYEFHGKFRPDQLQIFEEYSMPQHAFRIKVKSA